MHTLTNFNNIFTKINIKLHICDLLVETDAENFKVIFFFLTFFLVGKNYWSRKNIIHL